MQKYVNGAASLQTPRVVYPYRQASPTPQLAIFLKAMLSETPSRYFETAVNNKTQTVSLSFIMRCNNLPFLSNRMWAVSGNLKHGL